MLPKGLLKEHAAFLSWMAKLTDLVLFLLAGLVAFYIEFQHIHFNQFYLTVNLFAALLVIPVFSWFGLYQPLRGGSLFKHFVSLCAAIISVMLLLTMLIFLTKTGTVFSRAWFCIWAFNAAILLSISHLLLRFALKIMRKHGWNQRNVLLVGAGAMERNLIERVHNSLWSGFNIVAKLEHNESMSKTAFREYVERIEVDEVWLALPLQAEQNIKNIVTALEHTVVNIRYFPDMFGVSLFNCAPTEIFGLSAVNIVSSPIVGINRLVKAIEDRGLALLILLLISPVLLIVAILVKLSSPGSVFYRQERMSWNGKKFSMLKFRSMPVNSEQKTGAVWANKDDNRATKIGAFLRKTSLDELPQFINVLQGEMSIVGPRPERPVLIDSLKHQVPNYMQKHLVKAGITGWAQVNGWRGNTSLVKRVEHDLYYIEHWSLWFDLKIILLTLVNGFVNKNAY